MKKLLVAVATTATLMSSFAGFASAETKTSGVLHTSINPVKDSLTNQERPAIKIFNHGARVGTGQTKYVVNLQRYNAKAMKWETKRKRVIVNGVAINGDTVVSWKPIRVDAKYRFKVEVFDYFMVNETDAKPSSLGVMNSTAFNVK